METFICFLEIGLECNIVSFITPTLNFDSIFIRFKNRHTQDFFLQSLLWVSVAFHTQRQLNYINAHSEIDEPFSLLIFGLYENPTLWQ